MAMTESGASGVSEGEGVEEVEAEVSESERKERLVPAIVPLFSFVFCFFCFSGFGSSRARQLPRARSPPLALSRSLDLSLSPRERFEETAASFADERRGGEGTAGALDFPLTSIFHFSLVPFSPLALSSHQASRPELRTARQRERARRQRS